jgi:hypothetical protein
MRWQTTAVLALILAALGAFYYVYEIRLGPDRELKAARHGRVFSAEPKDATGVAIKREGGTVRLAREGDGWQMEEPVKARADRGAVEEVLTNILTAKMDREIAAAPASLADFGLQTPSAEVDVTLKDGKHAVLLLGAKNPTGVWVYAREKDKQPVFLVGESVFRDATRPLTDFRDKTLLTFDRNAVSGVELVTRDDSIALQPKDGRWAITRPVSLPADGDLMSEFLDKLSTVRVKDFVAESPRSLAPYGLDRPFRIVIQTGKEGERATKSLLLGNTDDTKKGIYALRPGETSVLLLPEEVWKAVPKNVAVLRDKTVIDIDRDKLARLDIESPRGHVTVTREKDRWQVVTPEPAAADQVEVGAVVSRLRDLRALAFLSEDSSGIAQYLAQPEVKVTLTDQAGQSRTLLLAPSPEKRAGEAAAYAAVTDKGPVVLVDAKALTGIGRSPLELRDRTLVSGLEPRDVSRVRVKSGGQTTVLERRGDGDWRVLEPSKGPAKSRRVDDLLFALRGLKWTEMVAPTGGEPAQYGLDSPALEVTLYGKDGKETNTILIGKQEGNRTFVRTQAAPAVFALDAGALTNLPKTPDDFKA